MAIKQITATVGFTDPQNNTLANGLLTLDLFQSVELTSGGGQVVPTRVSLPLDTNGKILGQPVNLWANDQMTPSGTVYIARLYNSNGLLVSTPLAWSIQGASPIDVSQEIPVATTISFPSVVLQNPSSLQTITGAGLTLTSSVPLQINNKITSYNGIATVAGGVASEIVTVDLTAQSAAITTTTLYAVPASGAGSYRLSWSAKVTTVAGVSSTLGALTIVYTDPDAVVQTIVAGALSKAGAIETSDTGNVTTTVLLGIPLELNCAASTNITYAMAYASNAANAMLYNLHLKLEVM